jgi:hypothetical protein
MNCNINSYGLYDINAFNFIATNATVLSSLNVAGNIIGSGTALSNLNYSSITNPPDLTQYNAWTKLTGADDIYNTSLSNGKVGIGLTNIKGILELTGDSITNIRLKFGNKNTSNFAVIQVFSTWFFRFLTAYTASNEIAYFGYVDSYDDPINRTMVLQITRTDLNMTGNIGASGSLNISGTTKLNNSATLISSLNVSGATILNNSNTINSSLNVSGTTTINGNIDAVGSVNIKSNDAVLDFGGRGQDN